MRARSHLTTLTQIFWRCKHVVTDGLRCHQCNCSHTKTDKNTSLPPSANGPWLRPCQFQSWHSVAVFTFTDFCTDKSGSVLVTYRSRCRCLSVWKSSYTVGCNQSSYRYMYVVKSLDNNYWQTFFMKTLFMPLKMYLCLHSWTYGLSFAVCSWNVFFSFPYSRNKTTQRTIQTFVYNFRIILKSMMSQYHGQRKNLFPRS